LAAANPEGRDGVELELRAHLPIRLEGHRRQLGWDPLPGLRPSIRPWPASRLRPIDVWHPDSLRTMPGAWIDELAAVLAPRDCESRSRDSPFAETELQNAISRDRDFAFAEADLATGSTNGSDSAATGTATSTGTNAWATLCARAGVGPKLRASLSSRAKHRQHQRDWIRLSASDS